MPARNMRRSRERARNQRRDRGRGYATHMIANVSAVFEHVAGGSDVVESAPPDLCGRHPPPQNPLQCASSHGAGPGDIVLFTASAASGHLGIQYAARQGFQQSPSTAAADTEELANTVGASDYIDRQQRPGQGGPRWGAQAILATAPRQGDAGISGARGRTGS